MTLNEFVKPEDATNYDPNADTIGQRHRDDTRKEPLTLRLLNHLKKMRALKKLEAMKKQDVLTAMYGQSEGGDAGGGGMF
jgi:hypothetical protein